MRLRLAMRRLSLPLRRHARRTPRPRVPKPRRPLFYGRNFGRPPHRSKSSVRRGHRGLTIFLVTLGVFALLFFWAESRMTPIAQKLAAEQIHAMAVEAISDAVTEEMSQEDLQYENIVYFEKDVTGKITALKTNMVKMNHIKSAIAKNLTERILTANGKEIYIPLGNILNGSLLSGRGPGLPVKIVSVGMADVDYTNSFEAAGINQTRHQIWVNVRVTIDALLPLTDCETEVSTQVILAETVIVGEIPDSFTQFGSAEIFETAARYDALLGGRE